MKKIISILLTILIVILFTTYFINIKFQSKNIIKNEKVETEITIEKQNQLSNNKKDVTSNKATIANPASVNCEKQGGTLEIITNNDGSQFGLCNIDEYSCEEWSYFRGECNNDEDEELIKQALIKKGLNLEGMQVEINSHLGKYIEATVIPISQPSGGGYVFAVKNDNGVDIVADGNGTIFCEAFEKYPDFSTYLIPECVDKTGNLVKR